MLKVVLIFLPFFGVFLSIYGAAPQNNFFIGLACARFDYIIYAIYGDKLCKKTTPIDGARGSAPPTPDRLYMRETFHRLVYFVCKPACRVGGLYVTTFRNRASLAKGRMGGRIFMSPPRWDIYLIAPHTVAPFLKGGGAAFCRDGRFCSAFCHFSLTPFYSPFIKGGQDYGVVSAALR